MIPSDPSPLASMLWAWAIALCGVLSFVIAEWAWHVVIGMVVVYAFFAR